MSSNKVWGLVRKIGIVLSKMWKIVMQIKIMVKDCFVYLAATR